MTTDKDREPDDADADVDGDAEERDAASGDDQAPASDDADDADEGNDAGTKPQAKATNKAEDPPKPPPGPPRQSRLIQVGVITALVVIADLWSKAWAWGRLKDGEAITVIEKWFYFEFGFNTGSAFSLGRDAGWARMAFIGVTILALLYMARLAMTLPTRFGVAFVSVAMVAGGAIGNLHDRLFRLMEIRGEVRHGVVDFIKIFYWPGKVWPTFNIADVALVVGVGLLLIFLTKHGDALDAEIAAAKKK